MRRARLSAAWLAALEMVAEVTEKEGTRLLLNKPRGCQQCSLRGHTQQLSRVACRVANGGRGHQEGRAPVVGPGADAPQPPQHQCCVAAKHAPEQAKSS